jgi:hypothetical protein
MVLMSELVDINKRVSVNLVIEDVNAWERVQVHLYYPAPHP